MDSMDRSAIAFLQHRLELEYDTADNWDEDYEINRRFLAFWVGCVAVGLPVSMLVFGSFGCLFDSISHYYYDSLAGTVFTGLLVFIGSFLFAYRSSAKWVSRLSTAAGVFAFGIALFPTDGTGCRGDTFSGRPIAEMVIDNNGNAAETVEPVFSLAGYAAVVHFGSAAVFFLILAVFCLVVFTRLLPQHVEDGTVKPVKARRNRIYRVCGVLILFAMAAMAMKAIFGRGWPFWNDYNLTFWFESLALWAFGVSWALKGRLGPFSDTVVGRNVLDPEDRRLGVRPLDRKR